MPSITLRLNKTLQIVSKTCQLVAGKSTTQQQNKKNMLYHKTINRCLVTYKSLKNSTNKQPFRAQPYY